MVIMNGKLFVIEGVDGSGKQTQTELLYKRLKNDGYKIMKASYPNYESSSSALVKMYLGGEFGQNPDDVDPYVCSTFYAVDRYATFKINQEKFYNEGGIILTDRYTTSNMVHQASKIEDEKEKDKYLDWLMEFEYNLYKIPKPTKIFFLDIPPEVTSELIKNRQNKIDHQDVKDIHEKNTAHMTKSYNNALGLCIKYDWKRIRCYDGEKVLSIEEINDMLYSEIVSSIEK